MVWWWAIGCGGVPSCEERVQANDEVLNALERVAAERQPWDLQADRGTRPPVVDTALVVREHPATLLVRTERSGWRLHGQPLREPVPAALCAGVEQQRTTLGRMKAAGVELPFRMALDVDGQVEASEVGRVLEALRGCGVDEVDVIVQRATQPDLQAVRALPDEPDPLGACPLPASVGEADFDARPAAFRAGAREALLACDCAVPPERFALEMRRTLVPAVFTNVVPLPTDTTLGSSTWQETIEGVLKR